MKIHEIFAEMQAYYGHLWKSQYNDDERMLALALEKWGSRLSGMSDVQHRMAIEKSLDFCMMPPTFPQFHSFCFLNAEDSGIPKKEIAFKEQFAPVWKKISSWDRDHMSEKDLKRLFFSVYDEVVPKLVERANRNLGFTSDQIDHDKQELLR